MSNVTTHNVYSGEIAPPAKPPMATADLVHEINSPLAYSLLSAQIALRSLRDDESPAVRRCIERAIEGIHRASLAARELLHDH